MNHRPGDPVPRQRNWKNELRSFFHGLSARACLGILAACTLLGGAANPAPEPPEGEYLDLKKSGFPDRALNLLGDWTLSLDDPALVEVNVLRIRELAAYPELIDRALEALNRIADRPSTDAFARDRIDIIKVPFFLKKGEVRSAGQALARLSYMDFDLSGPFTNPGAGGLDAFPCAGRLSLRKDSCTETGPCRSRIAPDRAGIIDMDLLDGDTTGTAYCFRRDFLIREEGSYYCILGKTGHTDLMLDGERVFSDRSLHGFDHDQYFIPVRLSAGTHSVVIQLGSSSDGIKLSFRIAGAERESSGPGDIPCCPPALSMLMRTHEPANSFRAGYLLSSLGRSGDAARFLARVPAGDPYYPSACYYLARTSTDRDAAAGYYRKAVAADPGSLEALRALADLSLDRGLVYEAFPHLQAMNRGGLTPSWYDESMARLFTSMGWNAEARRHIAVLERSPFPSAGLRADAALFRAGGDRYREALALERLMEHDRYDRNLFLSLAAAYEKTGRLDEAILMLQQSSALFPNDTEIMLRLAEAVQRAHGPGPALPYLAAALASAPSNPSLLGALGMAYLNLGETGPAAHYLRMAVERDPGSSMFRTNLEIITGGSPGKKRPSP